MKSDSNIMIEGSRAAYERGAGRKSCFSGLLGRQTARGCGQQRRVPMLIESHHTLGTSLGTPSRTVYSYDEQGRCISEIKMVSYDGGYEGLEKIECEYDKSGRMIRKAEYDADFGDNIHKQEGQKTNWVSSGVYT